MSRFDKYKIYNSFIYSLFYISFLVVIVREQPNFNGCQSQRMRKIFFFFIFFFFFFFFFFFLLIPPFKLSFFLQLSPRCRKIVILVIFGPSTVEKKTNDLNWPRLILLSQIAHELNIFRHHLPCCFGQYLKKPGLSGAIPYSKWKITTWTLRITWFQLVQSCAIF